MGPVRQRGLEEGGKRKALLRRERASWAGGGVQAGITEFPTSHASRGQVGADLARPVPGQVAVPGKEESGKERPACWPGGPHGVLERGILQAARGGPWEAPTSSENEDLYPG